jgi:hypothetical protein
MGENVVADRIPVASGPAAKDAVADTNQCIKKYNFVITQLDWVIKFIVSWILRSSRRMTKKISA